MQLSSDKFGFVVAEANDLPPVCARDGRPLGDIKYTWKPSTELARSLPAGFEFPMRLVNMPDGLRRFYPASFERIIASGFVGGMAIISQLYGLSQPQRNSYRFMYQLFRRLTESRERLANRLLNATSLRITQLARATFDERSIIPESLGLNDKGEGSPWNVGTLLREGRVLAVASGIPNPTEDQCVHYGFLAAARLNPLYIAEKEVLPLVRLALYEAVSDGRSGDPDLIGWVVRRTIVAIRKRARDSSNRFEDWLAGPKGNFVRDIAERKLLPGGKLDRGDVRRALQELGWQAYRYVGDCIHVQMVAFLKQFPEPLAGSERKWFEQMYFKQKHFGDLPLVMLIERFPFVRGALWEVWENPGDRNAIAVFLRLLDYYAEMASARRGSDRLVKQKGPSRANAVTRRPLTVQLPGETADASDNNLDDVATKASHQFAQSSFGSIAVPSDSEFSGIFSDFADAIRQKEGIRCSCSESEWDDKVVFLDNTAATIEHTCTSCGFSTTSTSSIEQLKSLAIESLA